MYFYAVGAHTLNLKANTIIFFFWRDFIFKKTLFEKIQY